MANQMKAIEQYFHVVPFLSLNIQLILFVKFDTVFTFNLARVLHLNMYLSNRILIGNRDVACRVMRIFQSRVIERELPIVRKQPS